jgi:RNA polymerase sigma-70 factor (ECF subfamily)
LIALLTPIHAQAATTARRLGRSADDGDDLFQEAVLRAHARISGLRDDASFRPWFFAVLLSVHRNRSRRSFWSRFVPWDASEPPDGISGVAENRDLEEERHRAERASRALATLPAVQREAVVLHDVEGYSVEEVAEMQGVTISAVKSRLVRGRERLRRRYERWALTGALGSNPAARANGNRLWADSATVLSFSSTSVEPHAPVSKGGRE